MPLLGATAPRARRPRARFAPGRKTSADGGSESPLAAADSNAGAQGGAEGELDASGAQAAPGGADAFHSIEAKSVPCSGA